MAENLYKTNRHSCYLLEYNLVVVTKYRHPVLHGKLKEELVRLSYYIMEECWDCIIHEINTDKDHIHILFEAKPQVVVVKLFCNIYG